MRKIARKSKKEGHGIAMKAMMSHAPGGPETLELTEVETPEPGPGQLRIAVKAAGVNFPDTLIIRDLYQFKPPRPFAPGGEVAGIIEAVGDGVSDFAVGGCFRAGSMAASPHILSPMRRAATKFRTQCRSMKPPVSCLPMAPRIMR